MRTIWASGSRSSRMSAGVVVTAVVAALTIASPAMARPWHHHHYHHHHGFGTGAAIGFATGALIGGALAASPHYYYPPPAPAYSGAVQYCMERYRSYDPASGTYLGYDGIRHPCP